MKNLTAFKELVLKYESITLEDIENVDTSERDTDTPYGGFKAQILIHFSSVACTLCVPINGDCSLCVWDSLDDNTGCCSEDNESTYDNIYYAENDEQLLKAFKKRAKHMRKVLNEKDVDF